MRKINTGHPEAANELVSENVKEMSNPTRDGRAMIAAGMIHPDGASTTASASPAPTSPSALFAFRTDRRVQLAVHNTRLKAKERQNCSRSVLLFGWRYSLAGGGSDASRVTHHPMDSVVPYAVALNVTAVFRERVSNVSVMPKGAGEAKKAEELSDLMNGSSGAISRKARTGSERL